MLSYILQEKKKLWLLVIWDLLAGQISCSSELSMKKVYITLGPEYWDPLNRHHTCLKIWTMSVNKPVDVS